jgi:hypothetical protein
MRIANLLKRKIGISGCTHYRGNPRHRKVTNITNMVSNREIPSSEIGCLLIAKTANLFYSRKRLLGFHGKNVLKNIQEVKMEDRYYNSNMGGQILSQISKDMTVFDSNGEMLGRVDTVYIGSASGRLPDTGDPQVQPDMLESGTEDTIYDAIVDTFNPTDEIEEEVRQRLLYDGFVRVGRAVPPGPDYFITPDQISFVDANQVHLHSTRDELYMF